MFHQITHFFQFFASFSKLWRTFPTDGCFSIWSPSHFKNLLQHHFPTNYGHTFWARSYLPSGFGVLHFSRDLWTIPLCCSTLGCIQVLRSFLTARRWPRSYKFENCSSSSSSSSSPWTLLSHTRVWKDSYQSMKRLIPEYEKNHTRVWKRIIPEYEKTHTRVWKDSLQEYEMNHTTVWKDSYKSMKRFIIHYERDNTKKLIWQYAHKGIKILISQFLKVL